MISAVALIEEASKIEENRTIKDPRSPLVYQKVQAKEQKLPFSNRQFSIQTIQYYEN